MQGVILDYNIQTNSGVISGNDGKRYSFSNLEWRSTTAMPQKNTTVDFETTENHEAVNIYVLQNTQQNIVINNSSTSAAAIVSLIFGLIGMFSSWWLFGIPSVIAVISGHIARSNIKISKGRLDGAGLALAGLILGYIVICFYLLIIIGVVAALSIPQYLS